MIAVAVAALLAAVLLSTALVERAPALLRVRASASGRSETGR